MNFEVSDAFKLTGVGVVVFIKNVENGLPENSILVSEKRNLKWRVKCRRLWMHSVRYQKRFSNEKEIIGHASFHYNDSGDTITNAINAELNLGFEYLLEAVEHNNKPVPGEILIMQIK